MERPQPSAQLLRHCWCRRGRSRANLLKLTRGRLVRLRWLFLVGQLVLFPLARWGFDVPLAWQALAVGLLVTAGSNLAMARLHARRAWSSARLMGGVLVLDTALLTLVLAASGGAMNPFTVFYLVYVTLSAIVLSARWTMTIAALSLVGFALLFVVSRTTVTHLHGGTDSFRHHLQSMWAAYALAAVLVAVFLGKITRAIADQRDQIAALREANARNARLAGLTTLAAGAAHELGSPLATIAVAAHEACLRVRGLPAARAVAEDLDLIQLEVDRCQAILHQMAARATQPDDVQALTVAELAGQVRDLLGPELSRRVDFQLAGPAAAVALPAAPLAQAIGALVKNAVEASPADAAVTVAMAQAPTAVEIVVVDRGAGIAADELARIGEPFYTTKQPGHGMGLGVFLARAFVESRGGVLALASTPGHGTRATVRIPAEQPA